MWKSVCAGEVARGDSIVVILLRSIDNKSRVGSYSSPMALSSTIDVSCCKYSVADIRYRSELPIGTPVRLEGRLVKRKGRLAQMAGQVIRQADDAVIAEATGSFMIG